MARLWGDVHRPSRNRETSLRHCGRSATSPCGPISGRTEGPTQAPTQGPNRRQPRRPPPEPPRRRRPDAPQRHRRPPAPSRQPRPAQRAQRRCARMARGAKSRGDEAEIGAQPPPPRLPRPPRSEAAPPGRPARDGGLGLGSRSGAPGAGRPLSAVPPGESRAKLNAGRESVTRTKAQTLRLLLRRLPVSRGPRRPRARAALVAAGVRRRLGPESWVTARLSLALRLVVTE
jgi:hypothetical protein